ncbi:hypothetical protein GCM10009104_07080 [Marinobacterium maritimum]|uniref:PAS domain S-box-containing protein n=1 Tax=Marinobacterium maritimum TaxID=500162 RepID=A0ABN1I3Z2_9GAMM
MQLDAQLDTSTRDSTWRHRIRQSPLLAVLILASGLCLSFYLSSKAAQQSRELTLDRFQATVQQTTRVIQEKIDRFSLLMMTGRGLILNNSSLPSAEINTRWHRMFDSFQVDYGDLGVVGLSFTRFIPAHERAAFTANFNRQDTRRLKIFPPPADNQPSLAVLHLVPKSIEERMLGYDLMSEEKRRQAVLETMRTGRMVLSRPLSLLPTDINSLDYLQMLPVRSTEDDVTDRFLGIVTIGFSMSMLIEASLKDLSTPMRVELIDTRESLNTPSFDTHPALGDTESALSLTRVLNIGKHSLTLQISNLDPGANATFTRRYDIATLTSGLSLTLMLTLISMFFIITRQQALQLSRKMASRAEEMHQRYKSLFAQSPEAIVVHVNDRVELANQHAARLFGCTSPEELYHRPITDLVHPSSMELVRRRRATLSQGSPLEPAEQLLVRTNGQPFMAEVSSSLINHQSQEATQVIFRDISDEKQQRLEARMTHILLEHSHDALMVTDAKGQIELINPAFQRLTGYSSKNAIGRTPDLLNSGQHSSQFFYQLWSSITESGLWQGDIINRSRNGHLYIQETDIHALRNEDQEITHFVCLMRDVTEQRNGLALHTNDERSKAR